MTSFECHRLRAAIVDFAEGALDETSRARVERHLSNCTRCRDAVLALREVPVEIRRRGGSEPSEEFWAAQRDRIVRAIEQAAPPAVRATRSRAIGWTALGGMVAAAAMGFVVVRGDRSTAPTDTRVAAAGHAAARPVTVSEGSLATASEPSAAAATDEVVIADPWRSDDVSLLSLAEELDEDISETSEDSLI